MFVHRKRIGSFNDPIGHLDDIMKVKPPICNRINSTKLQLADISTNTPYKLNDKISTKRPSVYASKKFTSKLNKDVLFWLNKLPSYFVNPLERNVYKVLIRNAFRLQLHSKVVGDLTTNKAAMALLLALRTKRGLVLVSKLLKSHRLEMLTLFSDEDIVSITNAANEILSVSGFRPVTVASAEEEAAVDGEVLLFFSALRDAPVDASSALFHAWRSASSDGSFMVSESPRFQFDYSESLHGSLHGKAGHTKMHISSGALGINKHYANIKSLEICIDPVQPSMSPPAKFSEVAMIEVQGQEPEPNEDENNSGASQTTSSSSSSDGELSPPNSQVESDVKPQEKLTHLQNSQDSQTSIQPFLTFMGPRSPTRSPPDSPQASPSFSSHFYNLPPPRQPGGCDSGNASQADPSSSQSAHSQRAYSESVHSSPPTPPSPSLSLSDHPPLPHAQPIEQDHHDNRDPRHERSPSPKLPDIIERSNSPEQFNLGEISSHSSDNDDWLIRCHNAIDVERGELVIPVSHCFPQLTYTGPRSSFE